MTSPYLTVDSSLEIPPYQQVVEQIRAGIERGELKPDSLLPTVRQLAGDLGIAPNTVARAYAELQNDGWLVGDGRRGTRIARSLPVSEQTRPQNLRDAVVKFVASLHHRGFSADEITAELGRYVAANSAGAS